MSNRQEAVFWWESVAGPARFIGSAVDALLDCRNVSLLIPSDLAWRHEMRNAFRDAMEATPGLEGHFLEEIDVSEDGDGLSPGEVILRQFVLEQDRLRFRGNANFAHGFIRDNGLLRNRVVWIKGVGSGQITEWLEFIGGWRPSEASDGIFVIENRESVHTGVHTIAEIDYCENVDENSVRLFCWSMLTKEEFEHLGLSWRKYAVALLSRLCGRDVEVAATFMRSFDIHTDDPVEAITHLADLHELAMRGTPGSRHVLAIAREHMGTLLHARVWSAQIETLFPIIEENRARIIEQLRDELEILVGSGHLEQFGKPLESIFDLELGTLVYLMSANDEGERQLEISDWKTRERLFLLWKSRNSLAHRDACSPPQVAALLDGLE